MLYHLFHWLGPGIPGGGVFNYISFRLSATPYSRSACSACRQLPVAPSTNSGTIATRAMIASTVLAALNIA